MLPCLSFKSQEVTAKGDWGRAGHLLCSGKGGLKSPDTRLTTARCKHGSRVAQNTLCGVCARGEGAPQDPDPVTCPEMGEMHWQHPQVLLPTIAGCCTPTGPGSTEQGTRVELHRPHHCSSTSPAHCSGFSLLQPQPQTQVRGRAAPLSGPDGEKSPERQCSHPGSTQTPTHATGGAPRPLPACTSPPSAHQEEVGVFDTHRMLLEQVRNLF